MSQALSLRPTSVTAVLLRRANAQSWDSKRSSSPKLRRSHKTFSLNTFLTRHSISRLNGFDHVFLIECRADIDKLQWVQRTMLGAESLKRTRAARPHGTMTAAHRETARG